MQKINKSAETILSAKYKDWLAKLDAKDGPHPKSSDYYDDVAMNLFRCQSGVCAYTEMYICPPELFAAENWAAGRYTIPATGTFIRTDHFAELEHYDPNDKRHRYWNWDNLFMIHATINSRKSDHPVVPYLKPDLPGYSPEKYFDYDDDTHLFVPNTDIEDTAVRAEIQTMIDCVLYLNHGGVKNERKNYINELKAKIKRNEPFAVDRFFTSVAIAIPQENN